MKTNGLVKDFFKLRKVINSCENLDQINVSETFLNLFLKKWDYVLSELVKNEITKKLEIKKSKFYL